MKEKTFFNGLKDGLSLFGKQISRIINTLSLSIVYIFGVGISFLIIKILKKDLLDIKKKNEKTYWKKLNLKTQKIEEYYKQF